MQLDGVSTEENDQVLLIGATNRPQDLDEVKDELKVGSQKEICKTFLHTTARS